MVSTVNQRPSPAEPGWIVEGLLRSDALNVLVSPKGTGGHLLLRQLAAAAAAGTPFLDLPVEQTGPVLFLTRNPSTCALHLEHARASGACASSLVIPAEAISSSTWELVVHRVVERATEVRCRLLIVEGILQGLPPRPDRNDPKTLTSLDCLVPLVRCARAGLAVVVSVEVDLACNTRASRSILSAWGALHAVGGCLLLRRVGGAESRVRRLDTNLIGWGQREGLLYAIDAEGIGQRLTPRPEPATPAELDPALLRAICRVVRDNPGISGRMVRHHIGRQARKVLSAIGHLLAQGQL